MLGLTSSCKTTLHYSIYIIYFPLSVYLFSFLLFFLHALQEPFNCAKPETPGIGFSIRYRGCLNHFLLLGMQSNPKLTHDKSHTLPI